MLRARIGGALRAARERAQQHGCPQQEQTATVVMEESGGVDDEVEDLFDNLIEE